MKPNELMSDVLPTQSVLLPILTLQMQETKDKERKRDQFGGELCVGERESAIPDRTSFVLSGRLLRH